MKRSNFKKAIMTLMMLAAFVIAGSNSYAQPKDDSKDHKEHSKQHSMKTPEERATKKADRLKEKLNLTSDQYSKIYSSILSAEQQMQTLRNNNTDKSAIREQMKQINISTNSSIQSVLTSDQQAKFKEWKDKRMDGMKGNKKDKKGKGKHKGSKKNKNKTKSETK